MGNLYSLTKGQAAIVALVRAMRDRTGNLPPMPGRPARPRTGRRRVRPFYVADITEPAWSSFSPVVRVSYVGDRSAAEGWRTRHAPARHCEFTHAVGRVAHDRRWKVRKDRSHTGFPAATA
jgi:hypothetical protein